MTYIKEVLTNLPADRETTKIKELNEYANQPWYQIC